MEAGINSLIKSYTTYEKVILTNRELEYLSLVALGYRNKKIAEKLFVTKSTVKKMLEIIYRKLNAKDRANAIAIAFIHNIINAEIITKLSK